MDGERRAARIEDAWKTGTEDTVGLIGRVDSDGWIESEYVIEPARMVAMSMGDNRKVEASQINA